jgi:hypothetical protein
MLEIRLTWCSRFKSWLCRLIVARSLQKSKPLGIETLEPDKYIH